MKKLFASLLILTLYTFNFIPAVFAKDFENPPCDGDIKVEHLNGYKNSKVNLVKITSVSNIIQKENAIEVSFSQNFNSKYYKVGDYIQFDFYEDLKTLEGTKIIPECSSLIAKITEIQKPKWFSRNAKVCICFTHIILPDGTNVPISAKILGKKEYLQLGAGATAAKIAAYTLSIGGVGSGLGAAIGVAAGNTITGLIIGGSVGGGVGLVSGIVSPGLHYRAKKGQKLPVVLQDSLKMPKVK